MTLAVLLLLGFVQGPKPAYKPSTEQVAANYRRADSLSQEWSGKVRQLRLEANWLGSGNAFWYLQEKPNGKSEYLVVDAASASKTPLFNHVRLAETLSKELGRTVNADELPIRSLSKEENFLRFAVGQQGYRVSLDDYKIEKATLPTPPRRPEWTQNLWAPSSRREASPDKAYAARVEDGKVIVELAGGGEKTLAEPAVAPSYFARLTWFPDSKKLLAVKVNPGDRKKVYLLQSSPPIWGPAKLTERVYDRPGDQVDTFDMVALDPTGQSEPKVVDRVEYGSMPGFRAAPDGSLTYEKMDRGYGRFRIERLRSGGEKSTLFDDDPATFVDSTSQITDYLPNGEIVVSSERDGWHHLYLVGADGSLKQITKGAYVVRSIVRIDAQSRLLFFTASGVNPDEDPYYVHYYRVNFDGSGLVALTPEKGNHSASLSPNGLFIVDSVSTVNSPPKHSIRDAVTGKLIASLESADIADLKSAGWRPPQQFEAKGRDGKTDIFGVVFRPTNFDPKLRYPVLEDIYAGPQDSFVPKAFNPNFYQQRVAELGFIVVQIDGMGTRNRSKAFHDVCYQNLADAGLPDRIAWIKALAATDASVDITRVGVYGTSAGGQNSTGAVLFHPDFYKVAVSSCGCHDNRLDKIWWNEQWMGTIGPHYVANSNIENAGKLKGKLMLLVGELDSNVPPESTYRLGAALQAAGKEFELVVLPNQNHTSGGAYGERKRRDFFVRHLLGVEPPDPNGR